MTTRDSVGKSSGSYFSGFMRENGRLWEERRERKRWARVLEVLVWERKMILGLGLGLGLGFWRALKRRDL